MRTQRKQKPTQIMSSGKKMSRSPKLKNRSQNNTKKTSQNTQSTPKSPRCVQQPLIEIPSFRPKPPMRFNTSKNNSLKNVTPKVKMEKFQTSQKRLHSPSSNKKRVSSPKRVKSPPKASGSASKRDKIQKYLKSKATNDSFKTSSYLQSGSIFSQAPQALKPQANNSCLVVSQIVEESIQREIVEIPLQYRQHYQQHELDSLPKKDQGVQLEGLSYREYFQAERIIMQSEKDSKRLKKERQEATIRVGQLQEQLRRSLQMMSIAKEERDLMDRKYKRCKADNEKIKTQAKEMYAIVMRLQNQ